MHKFIVKASVYFYLSAKWYSPLGYASNAELVMKAASQMDFHSLPRRAV